MFFLVMMVLMLLHEVPELIFADRLFGRMDLCLRPGENFLGPDAVGRILHALAIMHHPLDIIGYPRLFLRTGLHSHIAKQLLAGKSPYFVLSDFDAMITYDLVDDKRPFQLIRKGGEFLLDLGRAFLILTARLHPSF